MKIIGESEQTYIIVMSKDEAANFAGEYSSYHIRDKWKVGAEIKMGDIYKKATESIADFTVVKESVDRLHSAAVRVVTKINLAKEEAK
jgi:hypothetical protein